VTGPVTPAILRAGHGRSGSLTAGTATVALGGELDPVTMPPLARRLAQVLADGPQRLVGDLAGVRFVDCASARLITGEPAGGE
jgi:anti-anti-sigma factor